MLPVPAPLLALVCASCALLLAPEQMLVVGLELFVTLLFVRFAVLRRFGRPIPGEPR